MALEDIAGVRRRETSDAVTTTRAGSAECPWGQLSYWRRPGKTTGVSATTNVHDSDLLWVFSSSTAFTPARSYDRFGAYAVLDHGGDHAAAALAARGYGRRPDPLEVSGARPVSIDVAPVALGDTIAIFRRWLALDDPAAVYAVAATLAANRAVGDPVWLLIVCAPSSGKTEILSAATGLPFVVVAAKVTEAALLSGTPKRERMKGATGGLLRQIGSFGVLLVKRLHVRPGNEPGRARRSARCVARSLRRRVGATGRHRRRARPGVARQVWARRRGHARVRPILERRVLSGNVCDDISGFISLAQRRQ